MGLDMYLNKVKIVKNATLKEMIVLNNYFDWLEMGQEYKFYEWCFCDEKDVRKDLVDECKELYKPHFSSWDKEKKYPFSTMINNVGYWRKANQIHNWMVENVQDGVDDCNSYEISKEQLEELLSICKKISKNHSLAEKLLPTTRGFFFGSCEYDDYYFCDIDNTIEIIEKVLKDTDFDNEIVFYSSSW